GASIYVVNAATDAVRRVTPDDGSVDGYPQWSPDGNRILYETNRDGDYEVYTIGVDGSNNTRLTDTPDFDGDASWSPDGRHIVFQSFRQQDAGDIFEMDADGSNPHP